MAVKYLRKVSSKKKWQLWENMKQRCYSDKYHARSPQYKECSICDEWLDDRQSFFDWVDENYYTYGNEQIDLDKDILVKGNKVYSPDTCIFAPHSINTYFENLTAKPKYIESLDKWKPSIYLEGKTVPLGYFDTEDEAKLEYIKHKEASILAKADLYKAGIPRALYKAMANWKIELSDWDK